MNIIRENVDLSALDPHKLTNNCKIVSRTDGTHDLVKEYSSIRIFDHYWDRGIKVLEIKHAGGTRNPKFEDCEI